MIRTYLLKPRRAQKFLDKHSQRETSLTMTSRYFHVMSPHNDVYQALPFDVFSEINEPLIAAADDADADAEDYRLEKNAFSRFKFSALLLGFLLGFLLQFSILEIDLLAITFWDENLVTKSQTNIVVYSLSWSLFTMAMVIASLRFLRKLVTINYSAVGGCSKDLLEEIVMHMSFCFGVGSYLAWVVTGVLWGIPAQTEYALVMLVVAPFWYKIDVMRSATDSTIIISSIDAEETMTAV
jgi:hypothetical protein